MTVEKLDYMSTAAILKAYSRIAILMGTPLISSGLAREMDANGLSQVNQTGTDSKVTAQATNDGILLEIGKSIEKQMAAGQTEQYRLSLLEGQYVRVVVEQKGIDVVVVLLGPDGKKLDEANSPNGRNGIETLSFIATVSGSYRVEVRPYEQVSAGRYEIKIADLRIPTEQDQKRVLAEKTYRQGNLLRREDTAESFAKAIENYKEALRLFRDLGDRQPEAEILFCIGVLNNR